MFSVSRPMLVVVLNCWVMETKETPQRSNISTSLAKSARDRVKSYTGFWVTGLIRRRDEPAFQ
jgi:hypothetical protein